jgi:hypothetical protein
MAFPNPAVTDIMATTIQSRSRKIADNVTKNSAILMRMSQKGKIKPFSGGYNIMQELSFAENANGGWYSGYDILPVGVSDVISAAEYNIKQCAVPVVISGLEMLQNSGRERMIDLMDGRLSVAESTMKNIISEGLYSDGTGSGFKQIDGLDAAIPNVAKASQVDTYGGITRNATIGAFWRTPYTAPSAGTGLTSTVLLPAWNNLWADTTRGSDRVDLIMCDSTIWAAYMGALQAQQRFTDPSTGNLGFPSLKFMDADVVLDGGIGGSCPAGTAFFLNTDYLCFRPHSARDMVPLSPNKRYATNQDAEVQILAWAGNLACSGAQFQGRYYAAP